LPAKQEKAPEAAQQKTEGLSLGEIRALADSGALRDALTRCAHFLEEHHHHKEAYFLMGLIHFSLDSFASAEDFFQKVLYLDPCHDEALVHMGLLYEKRGEQAKAAIMRERLERTRMNEAARQETP
jgi:chemotaxis protein methyltransferase WspC